MANIAYLRAFVCLILGTLVTFQVAFAQADSSKPFGEYIYQKQTWERFWYSGNPSSGYTPVPTNAPVPSSKPIGNWNIDTSGSVPTAKTNTPFQFPNASPDIVDVSAKFKMRDLAGALARFASKVFVPLSIGQAIYDLAREIGFYASRNPDGSVKWEKDGYDDTLRPFFAGTNPVVTGSTAMDVCQSFAPPSTTVNRFDTSNIHGELQGRCYYNGSGFYVAVYRCVYNSKLVNGACQSNTLSKVPSTQQEFEDSFVSKSWSGSPKLADAIRDAINAEPNPSLRPQLENPTLTGPATGTQPKIENKTNTDGSTSTTTTTQNYNYIDNSIKNTTTTITSNYNPVTDTTTTTTTTNNQPNPDPPKDPCEGKPDRIGCLDIDTPALEIPKKTQNVSYVAENLFGGGSCPAPKTFTYFGIQHSLSYQGTCDALTNYVRFIVIASALFSAYLMILAAIRK